MSLSTTIPPRDFVELCWQDQIGVFELATSPKYRRYFELTDALASFDGKRYFAPLARKERGSKKEHVADVGNVLWADIDSLDAPRLVRDRLVPRGIEPSALVFSGNKGYWVYLKLDTLIDTDRIETMNRGLARLLDGDHCWNRDRLARLPGSVHEDSGKAAYVVEMSGAVYTPEEVSFLADLAEDVPQPEPLVETLTSHAVPFPMPRLAPDRWRYIDERPARGGVYDRSREEQRIFKALVGQGWSDEQIIAFADTNKLPRHSEERRKHRDYRWTLRSISKARADIGSESASSLSTHTMCKRTVQYHWLERETVLRCVRGQTTSALIDEVVAMTGHANKTVSRALAQLEAAGYVVRTREGRCVYNRLTDKGRKNLSGKFKTAVFVPTLDTIGSKSPRYRA